MDNNRIIQGLWIGSKLSIMERMSISSFLMHGHEYHLYVYDDVKQIPKGTTVRDGNEILPSSMIFQYKDFKSYSGFSNFFRYKLLLDRGGWWVDGDIICLKNFDFPEEHVFSSEALEKATYITSGVIKAPANSPAMAYAWQMCQSKNPEQLQWGETGPKLMAETVKMLALDEFVKPYGVFCPLTLPDWDKVIKPEIDFAFDETTYAIHLWNEAWRRTGQDKNQSYHPDCLYEKLKRRFPGQ